VQGRGRKVCWIKKEEKASSFWWEKSEGKGGGAYLERTWGCRRGGWKRLLHLRSRDGTIRLHEDSVERGRALRVQ